MKGVAEEEWLVEMVGIFSSDGQGSSFGRDKLSRDGNIIKNSP